MSSRQLHSHGESDGLSLPERTRKSKKSSDQPDMDQQTSPQPSRPGSAQLPTGDSATPATSPAARTESTMPPATGLAQTPATHAGLLSRMGSPEVPLQNAQMPTSHISPISGPLFTEDRHSTSSEQEICDQEVTTIICENTAIRSTAHTIPSRTGSIATVDYSTQGDLGQSGHSLVMGLVCEQTSILNTCNYLLLDGTGRRILDIPISKRKPFVLENGHIAYQIQLETLEPVLETSTHLLDRLTGQFHMIYDNGYRTMATTPMLLSTWHEGQLVDELEETHALFGLPPKEALSPARQPAASQHLPPAVIQRSQSCAQNTAGNDEAVPDLTNQPAPPRTVECLEPSFSLDRPVRRLEMDKRLEVHNNCISAIATLGKTLLPDQFTFIMQHAVHPLIQIKLPTHLCSPADVKFEQHCLTAEESFEEECSNKVLPWPFHPKLDTVPAKHATHCVAAAVHMLLCKHFFNTKMSQAKCADLFTVHPKKLHMAVSG